MRPHAGISWTRPNKAWAALLSAAVAVTVTMSSSATAQEVLRDSARTNGAESLAAILPVKTLALQSSVLVGRSRGDSVLGIVVSPDGYVLAPASESVLVSPLRVFAAEGPGLPTREVKRDDRLNLVLLKVDRPGWSPVAWGESLSLDIGHWVVAPTGEGKEVRLGVVSANRRLIPNSGAVLGVRFGVDDEDTGVLVEEVAADSPAEQGGLVAEDLILAVEGKQVSRNQEVAKIIAGHKPGDLVKVRYRREGADREAEIRLASKSRVLMNWTGEDFGNHGTSVRTDNFPEVIQHDLPLGPDDMGGAIFDLHGRAVGINIARVDRVTNYALPVELFLLKWLRDDRTAKRAKPLK
jgi:S1-C subfamily serine protease